MFPLQVGVHHRNHRFVIAHLSNDYGHCLDPQHLTRRQPSVPGDQLVPAFLQRTSERRCERTKLLDALDQPFHLVIVLDFERVLFERVKLI